MGNMVWFFIMVPSSALFTIIGIYAWNRKKPMWFWAESEVRESEISDVSAYNHANGLMWILYSLIFWAATFVELWNGVVALILIAASCVIGLPVMGVIYKRIYRKYKV